MNVLDSIDRERRIPAISGNLGVSVDEGTGHYRIRRGQCGLLFPLTGWLTQPLGRSSCLLARYCYSDFRGFAGLQPTLPILLTARVLQGGRLPGA